MNTITETKKIYLTPSGAQLTDAQYSNLTFNIPGMFSKDKYLLYNTIKVLHTEIPYSWYLLNEYNDKLVLSTGTITLTHGSDYNANTFITELQSKLPTNMLVSFNSLTGKFTLTYTSTFSILSTTTCYKLLGCAKNTVYISTSNILELPYLCNFLGTKNLYINVPNLLLDNYNSATKTYSTLLCIAVTVSPYGIVFYENNTSNKNVVKGIKDDTLQIQILDDDFNQIDFNHIEWSITLEIETTKQLIYINNQILNS